MTPKVDCKSLQGDCMEEGKEGECTSKLFGGDMQITDKDVVSFDTLKFNLTRELLAEATWILDEGEFWFKKVPFTFDAQRYLLPSVVADWGKGVPIQNFKPEWIEPIKILQSYVTCEGRFAIVFKYHFLFLQHISHESKMNLSFFFLKSL